MARQGFQREVLADDDRSTFDADSRGAGRARFATWLFAVAALTFAAGYYLPLHRTHGLLVAEYTSLAARVTTLETDLAAARRELGATAAQNGALSARQKQDEAGKEARALGLERLKGELAHTLAPRLEKRELTLSLAGDHLVVSFPAPLTQSPSRTEVTHGAQLALCEITAALTSAGAFAVSVVATSGGNGGAVPPALGTRDAAATRAATVARSLEQRCGYPGGRLSTVTRHETSAENPWTRIDLELGAASP